MKIAVLGAGHVGGALGRRLAGKGHEVTFGVPDAGSGTVRELLATIPRGAGAAGVAEAARGAEAIVLATPWPDAARDALRACGDLRGRVVIDATNPLKADFSGLEDAGGASGAEQVAAWAEGARVFKAFNQTGWENMADPAAYAARPVMFACGDDPAGKVVVLKLVEDVGFEAVDAGDLGAARLLEAYAMLWISLARADRLGRDFAFALTRPERGRGA